jgi:tripartite-type tricarboxylate transporter receptor subunit TctC
VTLLGTIAQFIAVPQDFPAKTLQEFVALAEGEAGLRSASARWVRAAAET